MTYSVRHIGFAALSVVGGLGAGLGLVGDAGAAEAALVGALALAGTMGLAAALGSVTPRGRGRAMSAIPVRIDRRRPLPRRNVNDNSY